uniref:Uncharacterized protein n=1 Tax=Trichogramma kaykai TaxID=54128 RepID=A0ABD2WGD9_9HYME
MVNCVRRNDDGRRVQCDSSIGASSSLRARTLYTLCTCTAAREAESLVHTGSRHSSLSLSLSLSLRPRRIPRIPQILRRVSRNASREAPIDPRAIIVRENRPIETGRRRRLSFRNDPWIRLCARAESDARNKGIKGPL